MGNYATDVRVVWRLPSLAISLAMLVGGLVLYGLCSTSYYVLRGFFHFVDTPLQEVAGWFGGAGKWVYNKIVGAEQKVTHWLGQGVIESEHLIGYAFHDLAVLVRSVGYEIYAEAAAFAQLVEWVVKVDKSVLTGEAFQEIFRNDIRSQTAQTGAAARTAKTQGKAIAHADTSPIAAGTSQRVKVAQAGVDHAGTLTLPGLRDLTRQREDALGRDITGVREDVRVAEGAIGNLWAKVRHLDKVTVGALASALVATALGSLGAGWIRCSKWGRIGKAGCSMPWHLMEDFLALITDFAVLTSICRVLPWLETAFADIATPMIEALTKAGAALKCGGGLTDEILTPPALYLPASSSTTLHLP